MPNDALSVFNDNYVCGVSERVLGCITSDLNNLIYFNSVQKLLIVLQWGSCLAESFKIIKMDP